MMRSDLTPERKAQLLKQRDELFTRLDGPLFAQQRTTLGELMLLRDGLPEEDHLRGLVEFTDQFADVAHDLYGIPCLLYPDGYDPHVGPPTKEVSEG